ncbi:MAG: response regulator [Planctomycetaceae bacterium]|nr:response regulator [Planctomycetaceae bacterium]
MLPHSLSILVVDDDEDTCDNLRDILSDLGYSVTIAHSGEEALALIHQQAFDIALLDFKMPVMDGLTLYRKIRKQRASTVAVIISAYASETTTDEALHAGAWRVLNKPVDFDKLIPLIETAACQPLVMVVDDDCDLCDNLWDILREGGYRVDVAHSEPEVKSQLAGRKHGIALIDMKLPQGDGSGVFHLVRKHNPAARVILITGHRLDLQQQVEETMAEGADAVCYKPFEMTDLIGTIGHLAQFIERPR